MARQDLGKIISEITSVNVTVDNNVGVPSAEASISGTLTEKEVTINFKNLKGDKGDKPVKGTDYFTEEEKQQFTTETVGLVTAEGEKQVTAIGEKGTTETQKVTAEGTKQTNSVKNQGTTSLNAVKKVQTDIEALLNNQTASGNALSLNGKTGVQYDKEIQGVAGGYSGNFPLTTADLNGVYLLPSTGKFYVCIKAYNGTQISAPNANFEELSVYKNRDKLENLSANIAINNIREITSYEEIKNLKRGFYNIINIKSTEDFFSEIPNNKERTFCFLEKFRDPGKDCFCRLITRNDDYSKINQYYCFFNESGSYVKFSRT